MTSNNTKLPAFGLEAAKSYLQQALNYITQQDWESAIAICKKTIEIAPNTAEAYKLWGNCLQKMGQTAQAMDLYARALQIEPNLAVVYSNLGWLYFQQQDWQEALDYYQKAIAIDPNFSLAYQYLSQICDRLDDKERAVEYLYQAFNLDPNLGNDRDRLRMGKYLSQQGRLLDAIKFYRRAIELNANLLEAYQALGSCLEQLGEWEELANCYRQILKLNTNKAPENHNDLANTSNINPELVLPPGTQEQKISPHKLMPLQTPADLLVDSSKLKTDREMLSYINEKPTTASSPEALANLGNLYAQKQDWQKAISSYKRSLLANSKQPAVYRNLAKVLEKTGQKKVALECWYRALNLEENKGNPQEHLHLANTLLEFGNQQRAIDCYYQAIKLQPTLSEAYHRLGEILLGAGQTKEAFELYERAVRHNPKDAESYYRLGQAWSAQAKWEEASTAYQKSLYIDNNNSSAHHNLGDVLLKQEKWEEAIASFETAIALNPQFSWSYNNLGDGLLKLGRWQEATLAFQKAIELNKDFHWSYYNLGQAYLELGNWESAIASYREALKVKPDFSEAQAQLDLALKGRVQSDLDSAKDYYLEAIVRDPQDLESYYKAIEIEPYNGELYLGLANALVLKGQIEEAKKSYQNALTANPQLQQVYFNWGKLLVERQEWQEAILLYQQAIAQFPEEGEFPYCLGDVLVNLEQWEEAINAYNAALELQADLPELSYKLNRAIARQDPVEIQPLVSLPRINLQPNLALAIGNDIFLIQIPTTLTSEELLQIRVNGESLSRPYYWRKIAPEVTLLIVPIAFKNENITLELLQTSNKLQFERIQIVELEEFCRSLHPDSYGAILHLIATQKHSLLAESSQLGQLCQLLYSSLPGAKLFLEYGCWLTPSILYLEILIEGIWVLGNNTLLLIGEDSCQIAWANFFQISHQQVAAIAICSQEVFTGYQNLYSPCVLFEETAFSFSGEIVQKAYSLEFIDYLNNKPEYQKHLIRESIHQTIIERAPQEIRESTKDLIRKLQYFLRIHPVHFSSDELPFNIFIDRVIPVECDGLFISGWKNDPYNMLEGIEVIADLGFSIPVEDNIYSLERLDVNKHLENTRYGNFNNKLGFCAYAKVPDFIRVLFEDIATLHGVRFKIKLKGSIDIEIVPEIKYNDSCASRNLILRMAPSSYINDELLDNCIGPAISKLQKLSMAQVKVKEAIDIGNRVVSPVVSIIVPLYKQLEFIKVQIPIFANDPSFAKCQIIYVLDSPEQEKELYDFLVGHCALYEISVTLVIMERNSGYAAANNMGAQYARAPYLILMNSDILPQSPGWAIEMVKFYASSPKIGTLTPKLIYEDRSLQHAGMYFEKTTFPFWIPLHYYKGFPNSYAPAQISKAVPAVTGACLTISKELFDRVGGLNTDYIIGDFEDSDLCLQCTQLGYENWYFADVSLYHLERQSVPLNNVYTDSLAWRYNARLHDKKWGQAISQIMEKYSSQDILFDRKF